MGLQKANIEWDGFVNSGEDRHGIKAKADQSQAAKPDAISQVYTSLA